MGSLQGVPSYDSQLQGCTVPSPSAGPTHAHGYPASPPRMPREQLLVPPASVSPPWAQTGQAAPCHKATTAKLRQLPNAAPQKLCPHQQPCCPPGHPHCSPQWDDTGKSGTREPGCASSLHTCRARFPLSQGSAISLPRAINPGQDLNGFTAATALGHTEPSQELPEVANATTPVQPSPGCRCSSFWHCQGGQDLPTVPHTSSRAHTGAPQEQQAPSPGTVG